jgi:hypothetical protein
MALVFDSFWRAAAYCLRPRVFLLSLLPLVLILVSTVAAGYFFWEPGLEMVRVALDSTELMRNAWQWLDQAGLGAVKTALAPMLIIFGVTPLIVMASMLIVTLIMTPVVVRLVASRRFPKLLVSGEIGFWRGLGWALSSVLLALVALIVTLPLWLIPGVVFILPPVIWGWLTYRVMAFDGLSLHASQDELHGLMHEHRVPLVAMGLICGLLNALPTAALSTSAMAAAAYMLLLPVAVWAYTLVFVFSSLWFSHYCLAALHARRSAEPLVGNTTRATEVDLQLPL